MPDDQHVAVRLPDGTDRTLAIADIIEANLVVDWDALGKQQNPS